MSKKIFLISTIGTDLNIFKSLKYVVEDQRPDKALYILTDDKRVEANYKQIEKEIKNNYPETEISYIYLKETENVKKIINELDQKIKPKINNKDFSVRIDFTFGKKPISSGIFLWGLEFGIADIFIYVSGERRGTDNKVFEPTEIIKIDKKGILFSIYKNQSSLMLRDFRFEELKRLLADFLSEEIKEILSYFDDFCRGDFKKMPNQVFKYLSSLNLINDDLLKRNKDEIYKYEELKTKRSSLADLTYKDVIFAFKIQSFYFYDLIFSYYKREEFNEVLALFVNFLDNIFNYLIVENKKSLNEKDYFVDFNDGFLLKQIYKNEEKQEKPIPMSISRKMELLDFYKIDFFKFFDKKLINDLIYKRNNSIFGHGYMIVEEDDIKKIISLRKKIIKKIFNFDKDYYFWYPINVDLEVFFR